MPEEKLDRRVQRTRDLLKNALMQLIDEKGYDAVTIQDITERANLGRTTFYSHYDSKDDLFLDHHSDFASNVTLRPLTYDDLMSAAPPNEFILFLQALAKDKGVYLAITRAKDAPLIMKGIRQQMVMNLQDSLESAFEVTSAKFSLDMVVNYIVGAQLDLIDWWITTRNPHSAQDLATMLHYLQGQAIRDAFGIPK